MQAMFEGFSAAHCASQGANIHYRIAGSGPPLLLLHGHPQTSAMWHRVAPTLARQFTVVLADLRGYGDSERVKADDKHVAYSKRAMAHDMLGLMQTLGFERFAVCAHDRGARVAHRLAQDHPEAVSRLMLLDIAPTLAMYAGTTEAFARAYWHWFFLIQPAPLPERLIEADPVAYLRDVMGRRHAGLSAFDAAAFAEYERCIQIKGSASAMCEDYRAAASIDLEHDRADRSAGLKLSMPLRVLWGAQGVVARCFDVMACWHAVAAQASGAALPCGHYIAEEAPELLLTEMHKFFSTETP
jgi:haloacetate dehalogenase